MERLKSALHLSVTTVQQHLTFADPYSPAALLADPLSAFGPAASAQGEGGGGSARSSYSARGDGGGRNLVRLLPAKQGSNDEGAAGGSASDADAV